MLTECSKCSFPSSNCCGNIKKICKMVFLSQESSFAHFIHACFVNQLFFFVCLCNHRTRGDAKHFVQMMLLSNSFREARENLNRFLTKESRQARRQTGRQTGGQAGRHAGRQAEKDGKYQAELINHILRVQVKILC